MSSFTIRPCGPLPWIVSRLTPHCAATRRAKGDASFVLEIGARRSRLAGASIAFAELAVCSLVGAFAEVAAGCGKAADVSFGSSSTPITLFTGIG